MALDPAEAATEVVGRLKCTTEEADAAVQSAVEYIRKWAGFDVLTDDPDDPDADPQQTKDGVVLTACRIFQDTPLPSGSLSSFDDTFGGVPGVPKLLSSHLDQYYDHLDRQFGVA